MNTFIPSFFFQAEDGIRDWSVTGVQTCALPILGRILTNMAEVNKGFSGDTKCRSNREPQGNWYAIRLVLGRNWINDDNLKATYKEEGEQWQYGFFNLRRRCSARR